MTKTGWNKPVPTKTKIKKKKDKFNGLKGTAATKERERCAAEYMARAALKEGPPWLGQRVPAKVPPAEFGALMARAAGMLLGSYLAGLPRERQARFQKASWAK